MIGAIFAGTLVADGSVVAGDFVPTGTGAGARVAPAVDPPEVEVTAAIAGSALPALRTSNDALAVTPAMSCFPVRPLPVLLAA